jgi:hypothetical protein
MGDDKTWYVGDVWKPIATITDDETGDLADPDDVTLTVGSASAEPEDMERLSQGRYRGRVELNSPGVWRAVVKASEPFQASQPEDIVVLDPFAVA